MPRRNLIPFALLAVLTVLAIVFAIIGAVAEPSGAAVSHLHAGALAATPGPLTT